MEASQVAVEARGHGTLLLKSITQAADGDLVAHIVYGIDLSV